MKYSEEEFLLLSGIQHFCFCRRQWALIHIEKIWNENFFTAEGRILHERVHDKGNTERRGDVLTVRGMSIKSEVLGVSGECDAVIFEKSDDGVTLYGKTGLWTILPVEYKRGHTKICDCDRLQVVAQTMCLEEMFCTDIRRAAVYYYETKTREYIEITEVLRDAVRCAFSEMHDLFRRGYSPKVRRSKNCESCSLKDYCLPELFSKMSAKEYYSKHMEQQE